MSNPIVSTGSQRPQEAWSTALAASQSISSADVEPPDALTSRAHGTDYIKPEVTDDNDDFIDRRAFLTPVPQSRCRELQVFTEFVPDVDDSVVFNRTVLSDKLGGSVQPLIVKYDMFFPLLTSAHSFSIDPKKQKPLAEQCNMLKFLCPNLKYNPWCPTTAGQHGYMFVGLGNESETFNDPEELNLFLSASHAKGGNLDVSYLGRYEVCRVPPLTAAEWQTLSPMVK